MGFFIGDGSQERSDSERRKMSMGSAVGDQVDALRAALERPQGSHLRRGVKCSMSSIREDGIKTLYVAGQVPVTRLRYL